MICQHVKKSTVAADQVTDQLIETFSSSILAPHNGGKLQNRVITLCPMVSFFFTYVYLTRKMCYASTAATARPKHSSDGYDQPGACSCCLRDLRTLFSRDPMVESSDLRPSLTTDEHLEQHNCTHTHTPRENVVHNIAFMREKKKIRREKPPSLFMIS